MASISWYDRMNDEQRDMIKEWIRYLVGKLWPTDITLPYSEEKPKQAFDDFLYRFCTSFHQLSTEVPFSAFTAKDCYIHASTLGGMETSSDLKVPTKTNWLISDLEKFEFFNLRDDNYWKTEEGRMRMICSIIQAIFARKSFSPAVIILALLREILHIVQDFAAIYSVIMGTRFAPMNLGPKWGPKAVLKKFYAHMTMAMHGRQRVSTNVKKPMATSFGIDTLLASTVPVPTMNPEQIPKENAPPIPTHIPLQVNTQIPPLMLNGQYISPLFPTPNPSPFASPYFPPPTPIQKLFAPQINPAQKPLLPFINPVQKPFLPQTNPFQFDPVKIQQALRSLQTSPFFPPPIFPSLPLRK